MLLYHLFFFFFFNDTATTEIYTLSLHDALPIYCTSILTEGWKNSSWTNSYESLYTFDDNGNCIKGDNLIWKSAWELNSNDMIIYYDHNQKTIEYTAADATIAYVQVTGVSDENISVNRFSLKQNYPNPFNPKTRINYSFAKQENVKFSFYNKPERKVPTIENKNNPAG